MYIWQLFLGIIIFAAFILYIPELMPKCSCCRKYKPRFYFRIHKLTGLSPGYRGNTSVCKKCCRQYGISNITELQNVDKIKRSLRAKLWNSFK